MAISRRDSEKLFALSAGRCNICKKNIFERNSSTGERAHIVGRRIKGPRGSDRIGIEIDSYDNHILLCANDHKRVDENEERFPKEELLRIKREHEYQVYAATNKDPWRLSIVEFLNAYFKYSEFRGYRYALSHSPMRFTLTVCHIIDFYFICQDDIPNVVPFRDSVLLDHFNLMLTSYYELDTLLRGNDTTNGFRGDNFDCSVSPSMLVMQTELLSPEHINWLKNQISQAVDTCYRRSQELEDYIRTHYPEVKI